MDNYRPQGVIVLSFTLILFAVLGIYLVISIIPQWVTHLYPKIYFWTLFWMSLLPNTPMGFGEPIGSLLFEINQLYIMSGAFIILSLVYTISFIGLLQMKNWGRYTALIGGIISIAGGIILLTTSLGGSGGYEVINFAFSATNIMFGTLVITYLMSDVKYFFQ